MMKTGMKTWLSDFILIDDAKCYVCGYAGLMLILALYRTGALLGAYRL